MNTYILLNGILLPKLVIYIRTFTKKISIFFMIIKPKTLQNIAKITNNIKIGPTINPLNKLIIILKNGILFKKMAVMGKINKVALKDTPIMLTILFLSEKTFK